MDKERYEFCWIVDFPMYEIGDESRRAGVLPQPVLHAGRRRSTRCDKADPGRD